MFNEQESISTANCIYLKNKLGNGEIEYTVNTTNYMVQMCTLTGYAGRTGRFSRAVYHCIPSPIIPDYELHKERCPH